ncbi:MAG: Fic/DOC family N-terminal domain-containing protein [Pseudomonadota bacterium]
MKFERSALDLSEAVNYHYGKFPPAHLDANQMLAPLANASQALARYDQMLKTMHNSEILLAPLRNQEAVVSSRMEGTISTLDEVLQYQADHEGEDAPQNYRTEALEVSLYGLAMRRAQLAMQDGQPLSSHLIRQAHSTLLGFGRGATQSPGQFKNDQNYLADRKRGKILFIPISPEQLDSGMESLITYIGNQDVQILIRTAIAHLEFEALHPFKDGNGRIGRMLITLMLWHYGVVSVPHFYVSRVFEDNRDTYIDLMRNVSAKGAWVEWVVFFLNSLETQATANLAKAEEIRDLYETLKLEFRDRLSSTWSQTALDFLFTRPVFRNNIFTSSSGIPPAAAHRIAKLLVEGEYLRVIQPASGRRPALYSFEPLLRLVRD